MLYMFPLYYLHLARYIINTKIRFGINNTDQVRLENFDLYLTCWKVNPFKDRFSITQFFSVSGRLENTEYKMTFCVTKEQLFVSEEGKPKQMEINVTCFYFDIYQTKDLSLHAFLVFNNPFYPKYVAQIDVLSQIIISKQII